MSDDLAPDGLPRPAAVEPAGRPTRSVTVEPDGPPRPTIVESAALPPHATTFAPDAPPRPTIFALSSGRLPSGIAVVRLSGPRAFATLERLTGTTLPRPRVASLRSLRDPADGSLIDRAIVVAFAAPATATGEDVVEFHLHGGVAVVAAMLRVLSAAPGLSLAGRGAFARQAFDNGKLDLTQAEGLADLIDAETEQQRRQALGQAGGRFGEVVARWREAVIARLADVEARLDFAEEVADVADRLGGDGGPIGSLRREIAAALADAARGERVRDGLTIAVTGPPNAGKSSLVNALARRAVAIVAASPGTTRDVIEVRLDFGGVAVTLIDTAGLRDSDDPVEAEGIRRGRERAAHADLVMVVREQAVPGQRSVINKIDVSGHRLGWHGGDLYLSVTTGAGMAELETWLTDWARTAVQLGEPALVTRERHRVALAGAAVALDAGQGETDAVLVAERLRQAARHLGEISGAVAANEVLDLIFDRFCIGK